MIRVNIEHPEWPPGRILGFRFFWAFYVTGFRRGEHCQKCFVGLRSRKLKGTGSVRMDERGHFPYLYLCGVASGPRKFLRDRNFHLALRPEPTAREERTTYNGYRIQVENAASLPIPELTMGWYGLPPAFTQCKNFRFAVSRFGWDPR